MNVYEPCFFSKFAVREEPAVDGGSIAPGEFVGCVLLGVDDHLMVGPGKAHHESMERLRQRIKFGKWHRLLQDGPSFLLEDTTKHSYRIEALRLTLRDLSERDYDQFRYHVGDAWKGVMKRPRER